MNIQPLVSVVITTRNEEKKIKDCLESILAQDYPLSRIEIIVVDNNSQDQTKKIAGKYTNRVLNKGPERSTQRNFGAERAKGKYYFYLDADMILSKSLIQEAVNKLENDNSVLALYVPEIVMGDKFWCRVRRFERSFYNATSIDCVRFIRRKIFLEVGGFDENLIGPEDWDLDKKIRQKGRVDIIRSKIYHNETDFKLKHYLNKKTYYVPGLKQYVAKWGAEDLDVKKQLSIYYRFLGVFIEQGKWKKAVKHPFLCLGLFVLRFLVGLRYLFVSKKSSTIKSSTI